MRRSRTALLLLPLAAGCVFATAVAAAPGPPALTVTSRGEDVVATPGSFCWQEPQPGGGSVSICGDVGSPLPVRCTLPAKRGAKLTLNTGLPALHAGVFLIGADQSPGRKLRPIGDANASGSALWRFRMPRDVRDAAAIDVFAKFNEGDASGWAGLDTRTCRRAGFPKP